MWKFLKAILWFCAVAYLCMIFSFWAVAVMLVLSMVGYLLIVWFVVATESVLDKQNPVADFIRASKEAQANKGGQKGG